METNSNRSPRTLDWRRALDVMASVSLIALSIVLISVTLIGRPEGEGEASPPTRPVRNSPPLPKEPVSLQGAALQGRPDAPIAIIEFADFECPYCAKFARETWPVLRERYVASGQVLMAFRQLPLENIHRFAMTAAESAICAGRQGRFWDMHEVLFQNPKRLDAASVRDYGKSLGLDSAAFVSCLEGEAVEQVRADQDAARSLGISGTPTFLLGRTQPNGMVLVTERLGGAAPVAMFAEALDRLAAVTTAAQRGEHAIR
ncbi:MAG: DsbA family protein [Vicinamibacterales bacterium]